MTLEGTNRHMSKEQSALQSLATLRDQKIVFYNVRAVVNDLSLTPGEAMRRISDLYVAYDESHPENAST